MPSASHQTIRLSRGKHTGPGQGACVMELASMLAGERFSDHPASASAVIGAFLRAYNDRVDDQRRQSLYGYAAKVVGTRSGVEMETARAEICAGWMQQILADEGRFRWRRWRLAVEARRVDGLTPQGIGRAAGRLAAMLAREDRDVGHVQVLALLDRLIAMPGLADAGRVFGNPRVGREARSAGVVSCAADAAERRRRTPGARASGRRA